MGAVLDASRLRPTHSPRLFYPERVIDRIDRIPASSVLLPPVSRPRARSATFGPMADRTDRIVLEPLAELVPESDTKRRKVLTNLDRIAQGALDAVRNYTNKHGEDCTYAQPDWNVAVKAMESAKVLLGLVSEPVSDTKQADGPMARILAAVPK